MISMNPLATSIAGVIITLTGALAMLLMLELRGNPRKDKEANQRLIRAHRITGYLFTVFFCMILGVMFLKVESYQHEFSPRTLLHVTLAVWVIPLLFIKILIIRRFKRVGSLVIGFGLTIFFALFVLNSITGGYYFLHQSDLRYASLSAADSDVLDPELGQYLVKEKCIKCHTLERVFKAFKSEQGWTETVNRMALIDAPNIRTFDAKQMIHYLVVQQKRRERLLSVIPQPEQRQTEQHEGKIILEQKCTVCHKLDRIYKAEKNRSEWLESIERMIGYSKQMNYLNPQEKKELIEYLANQNTKQEPL
ncbi:MAG: hypothetical protein D3925_13770 [Candidatus Electrothrix sp. AR5]|nr:hypothetical protein [Candidatus Electrothrix sp. AR5]